MKIAEKGTKESNIVAEFKGLGKVKHHVPKNKNKARDSSFCII